MKNQQIYSLKQLNFYQIIISKATTVTTSSSSINSLQILAESIYYYIYYTKLNFMINNNSLILFSAYVFNEHDKHITKIAVVCLAPTLLYQ